MRILGDLRTLFSGAPAILQVEKIPPVGPPGATAINGKFVIPVHEGISFPIDVNSYILDGSGDIDGGDVVSEAFAHILARFPNFENIYFNPLITDDHVGELDLTATMADPSGGALLPTRAQTGRAPGGPEASGQMPNNTALLAVNNTVTPARPGVLITDTIDISAPTGGAGADEFALWWKVYDFSVSEDVMSDHGATAGENTPAIRSITEVDQEPLDLEVYLSVNGGGSWIRMGLLEPLAFCDKALDIKLAFVNRGTTKVYLTSYAVLF